MQNASQVFHAIIAPGGACVAYFDEEGVPVSHALVPNNAIILRPGDEGYIKFQENEAP